ncbi:hypothetical protein N7470_003151 [Penicillium chermesinum]|nr:hypothetical protein N7470_003151 [Penicillium chermesinum]
MFSRLRNICIPNSINKANPIIRSAIQPRSNPHTPEPLSILAKRHAEILCAVAKIHKIPNNLSLLIHLNREIPRGQVPENKLVRLPRGIRTEERAKSIIAYQDHMLLFSVAYLDRLA